jgi:hypothetical protein
MQWMIFSKQTKWTQFTHQRNHSRRIKIALENRKKHQILAVLHDWNMFALGIIMHKAG